MSWLDSIVKTVSKAVTSFVAFTFLIFTAGMLYGLFISRLEPSLLFIPPLLGLAAYYNPRLAGILLLGLLVIVFL